MRITVEEIARIAGVSKATVSRVLNNSPNGVGEDTRQRVQSILDEMNYNREFSHGGGRSKSIAVVIPDISNPFFADLVKAVEHSAVKNNYIVIIANTDYSVEKEMEYISKLVAKKIDGIILTSSARKVRPGHLVPGKYKIPMVLLDRRLEGNTAFPGIYSDTEYAAYKACELMIERGSDRVAFLSGHMGVFTSVDRYNGYKAAHKQYGLPLDDALVKIGDYMVESGYTAVMDMIREGTGFNGILAGNDLMALGALKALKELNCRVPGEVQVIGFDNIIYTQLCEPPLSTIQQPTVEMGWRATELIMRLIESQPVEFSANLQPRLILRNTTR